MDKYKGLGTMEAFSASYDESGLGPLDDRFYRFQKPADASYPFMLELFCRSPDGILLADGSRLTTIPFDEVVSSLSAILLDDAYNNFMLAGRREGGGLASR